MRSLEQGSAACGTQKAVKWNTNKLNTQTETTTTRAHLGTQFRFFTAKKATRSCSRRAASNKRCRSCKLFNSMNVCFWSSKKLRVWFIARLRRFPKFQHQSDANMAAAVTSVSHPHKWWWWRFTWEFKVYRSTNYELSKCELETEEVLLQLRLTVRAANSCFIFLHLCAEPHFSEAQAKVVKPVVSERGW